MNRVLIFIAISITVIACDNQSNQNEQADISETYELEFAQPEKVGLNPDSLAKIDGIIMKYVENKRYPGAVVLLAKNGKIVYETEVGWSDSLHTEPYAKDHIFRMASMTKPFTSVAAMQLYEQGKLDLEDPVSKYIPEFANPMVMTSFNEEDTTWESRPAHREPTIRHLLSHTAGVPYSFMYPSVYGAILATKNIPDLTTYKDFTIGEKMAELGTLPLMHDPGEKWMYGLNTDVLGRVVEVVSGMTLGQYIHDNITQPLKMNDMAFFINEEQNSRLVDVYIANEDSMITYLNPDPAMEMFHPDYPYEGAKKYFSGGSGMSGTARDYFVFCQMMLNDGSFDGTQILAPETAQLMHSDQLDTLTYPWGPARFGLGFDIADGHPIRPDGAYSWGGAFSTKFWIDPENEIVAIILSQVLFAPDGGMGNEFEMAVYNALVEEEVVARVSD
jgi:CubicO group peptidase (beta-lactamase class C family)